MKKKLTYISLFSGGGVGCFGFQQAGFDCVVTNEIIERRLDIQKYNKKCEFDTGYISGDITDPSITKKLFTEISRYKKNKQVDDIDVVIATPPCQGMSVANHKKDNGDIYRNSLVVDSIKIVKRIKPKFFVFENVQSFLNTTCYENDQKTKIKYSIENNLSDDYNYHSEVLNLKNYGSNSSRTRTLVIGVRKDLAKYISPILLFPDYRPEPTLNDVIGHLPELNKMGEIDDNDIFHNFKPYREDMRLWIETLKEGESAFDNNEVQRIPHRIVDGEVVINQNKNGDKYKRQCWNKVGPCIHTRNDILSSQNTVHPQDDRVFSIRELMLLMTIPSDFQWSEKSEVELNHLSHNEKKDFFKKNEINIRQCIGESVPTRVMREIAENIKRELLTKNLNKKDMLNLIQKFDLTQAHNLHLFIEEEFETYKTYDILKIAELANVHQVNDSAYYTDINTLNEIYRELPDFNKEEISILEPSVGVGNFLPFILKKYENKSITLDVFDINHDSLKTLELIINKMGIKNKVTITYRQGDFLEEDIHKVYDLTIGNPPFTKVTQANGFGKYREIYQYPKADNLASFFLAKALEVSKYVVMIMPKYFLHNDSFSEIREDVALTGLAKIIDLGEEGFDGVLIETITLFIDNKKKRNKVTVKSVTNKTKNKVLKSKIVDKSFPNWLIYRDEFFDEMLEKIELGIFEVFRDRQVTKSMLNPQSGIRVYKSRNIKQDGTGLVNIEGYDSYIDERKAQDLLVYQRYYNNSEVYMVPNMSYYPRMVKKPKQCIVNGSVALLKPKDSRIKITKKDMLFISSKEFRRFYSIARNLSTRSLNIDNNSVFYFPKLKG